MVHVFSANCTPNKIYPLFSSTVKKYSTKTLWLEMHFTATTQTTTHTHTHTHTQQLSPADFLFSRSVCSWHSWFWGYAIIRGLWSFGGSYIRCSFSGCRAGSVVVGGRGRGASSPRLGGHPSWAVGRGAALDEPWLGAAASDWSIAGSWAGVGCL